LNKADADYDSDPSALFLHFFLSPFERSFLSFFLEGGALLDHSIAEGPYANEFRRKKKLEFLGITT
jgi:hypothetical protein